jgi:hypothetical protein
MKSSALGGVAFWREITISGLYEYWDIYPLCRIECIAYIMNRIGFGA